MKNNRIDFEARFWSGSDTYSGLRLIETFFQFNELATAKEMLHNIMICAAKKKCVIKEDHSAVFHFHQALRSFVRACYVLGLKQEKSYLKIYAENNAPPITGALSDQEYRNPFLVFQKAFAEYSLKDFEYYISVSVYFSLGVYAHSAESKILGPCIHLTKMLDAAFLILERGRKKRDNSYKKKQRMKKG